jgi:GrpB-like predicted nucleotidyltransferase (UPF0157 family)
MNPDDHKDYSMFNSINWQEFNPVTLEQMAMDIKAELQDRDRNSHVHPIFGDVLASFPSTRKAYTRGPF